MSEGQEKSWQILVPVTELRCDVYRQWPGCHPIIFLAWQNSTWMAVMQLTRSTLSLIKEAHDMKTQGWGGWQERLKPGMVENAFERKGPASRANAGSKAHLLESDRAYLLSSR